MGHGLRHDWRLLRRVPWIVYETKNNDGSIATRNAAGDGGSLGSLNSYGYSRARYMSSQINTRRRP